MSSENLLKISITDDMHWFTIENVSFDQVKFTSILKNIEETIRKHIGEKESENYFRRTTKDGKSTVEINEGFVSNIINLPL